MPAAPCLLLMSFRCQHQCQLLPRFAGKPIFSRHGDVHALASFFALIQALMSVVQDQGDVMRNIKVRLQSRCKPSQQLQAM